MFAGISVNSLNVARKNADSELRKIVRDSDREKRMDANVESEINRLFKQREQYEKELRIATKENDLERQFKAVRTLRFNEDNLQKCLERKKRIIAEKILASIAKRK